VIVANALLVALAVSALRPAPASLPEPPGEIGNWSAADRREFMDTCRSLKAGEDAMEREGLRCERLSILPERRQGDGH